MRKITLILFFCACAYTQLNGQVFVKITDTLNPVVTTGTVGSYIGASWIDYNNDKKLDLFINRNPNIYANLGNGNFTTIANAVMNQGSTYGNTWADYDNDGDIDLYVSNATAFGSSLYRNDGGGVFTKITTGDIGNGPLNTAWGCAWGDYNNDGYVDLVLAAANGFGAINHVNRFYHNNGDGTFTKIDSTVITDTLSPFTVPTWSDYDLDGDLDLFIGSGPASGIPARDFLYRNLLKETGTAYFERIDTGIIGTDLVDGQVWNWIDYDLDGDLDGFLTNYANAIPNNLYRNEGNGYYVKMTSGQVGNIVSDPGAYLTNLWADFDNDGDQDCFVTRDAGQKSYYYHNNGDGTFTRDDTLAVAVLSGGNFGASAGDYDKDGDLDLYVTGSVTSKGLFRNDLSNGNGWVNVRCIGVGGATGSNLSAIGTKIKAKATVNGTPVWQMREVSAQNSFSSMSMLNLHFGFGNGTVIDSLVVEWPGGTVDVYTNVAVNNFYDAIEGQSLTVGVETVSNTVPERYSLHQNYPNPFNPSTSIKFDVVTGGLVNLKIYDMLGKEVRTLVNEVLTPGTKSVVWDSKDNNNVTVASGVYFYTLQSGEFISTKKMMLIK